MFKKLKDKLAEEVKSSPQRIQQFAQAAQAAVTSASSSVSDITNNDLFSIGDTDNSQNTTPKPQASPHQPLNQFQNVSLQSPSDLVDYTHEMDSHRQRRLSNSSFTSDVSFRLPSYETPSMYHLQSDMEVSASEADERGFSGGPATLERVTKEQLYSAYKRTQERYTKYRNQYGDLARHYKLLERENAKARSVLVETQDKALRRISELKEQCSLEQSAKAHLEKALRIEIEEKAMKIEALNTKVDLLQNTENSNIPEKNDNDVPLINLASESTPKLPSEDQTQEVANINNKIEKMEQLLNKYKESLKISKDKNSQMSSELQNLSMDIENKSKQIQEMKNTEERLNEANKKIKELNDVNEELQNQINSHDFTKIKKMSTLEMDLQKANDEITELRGKVEIFSKKEEEYAISLAENKLSIHKELESKEAEIKSLKNGLSTSTQEVQSLKIVLDDYKNSIAILEEEKNKLNKDCIELSATRTRIDEMNLQLQELSKKCLFLEQSKAKADEEYKCLHLQLKQETAEKLAMIDRNVYLESRNTQLTEQNTIKSTQLTNLANEIQVMSIDLTSASVKDESEVDKLLKELKMWKDKCNTLESEIQEEREELVKLQTEIEKLLTNHESIQAQNAEFRTTIANLSQEISIQKVESGEKQSTIANALKKMTQEANELRLLLSVTSSEAHSLLESNKQSFSSICNEVNNVINNSVKSLKTNIDVTTAQNSDIVKRNEKLQLELTTAYDKNYDILNEVAKFKKENTYLESMLKNTDNEKITINEKLENTCRQYENVLQEVTSVKSANETLQSKLKEFQKENQQIAGLSQTLESEKRELFETISKLDEKYKKVNDEFESVSKKYEESKQRVNSLSQENEKLTKSNAIELDATQKIQTHIENEKANLSAAVEQLKQLSIDKNDLAEKLTVMENKNKHLAEQLEDLNLQHQNTTIALRELEDEMVNKSNDLEKYKQNQVSLEVEIAQHLTKIEEITIFEKENQRLTEEMKLVDNQYKLITAEFEDLKKLYKKSEENISKLNADNKEKSEDCEIKLAQINELQERNNVLSHDNIKLKSDVGNFTSNIEKLQSEIEFIKKSHSDMEIEKDRLNEIIEKLERNESAENKMRDALELDSGKLDNVLNTENSVFENKWVLEHKQTAMTNTASLNLKTDAQEDIIEQYAALKINYDALKDDNRRLHSDIEGLQSYLTKISKENSVLNDKLREVIATSEHSMDNDQLSSDINQLKNELELGKEKINDLLSENSLLIEENLELKDQLNSQNYSKLPEPAKINSQENGDIKQKYDNLMQTSAEVKRRNDDLEQINKSFSGNNKQLQDKNEKLRLSNEKLERRLDEALVSLRHLHSLQENTELEYLRNILYEYLTGSGSHSLTLAKVLAAIVKFDDMQTQLVLQKEKERQGFLRQLGII